MANRTAKKTARKPGPFAKWRLLAQDGSRRFSIETRDGKAWESGEDRHFEGIASPVNDVPASAAAEFDELVVGEFLHVERMDARALWFRAGPATFWLSIGRDGKMKLTLQDGKFDAATREFTEDR